MRRRILRASVLAAVLGGVTLAYAFSTGPPATRTGAPAVANIAAEPLCVVCHASFAPNDPNGLLEILDVPDQYTPGTTYPLRVRLNYNHDPMPETPLKWGFEITVVRADSGLGTGTWIPPQAAFTGVMEDSLLVKAGLSNSAYRTRRYLEHSMFATHEGEPGPVEWHFNWQAPATDVGKIYFFAAGNAADGSGDNTGDHIFTARDSTVGDTATVGVPPALGPYRYTTLFAPPFPNPMTQCTDLSIEIGRSGPVDLSVFDVQGRKVRTIARGHIDAGPAGFEFNGKGDDGRRLRDGVYFIRLSVRGSRTITRRVTLSH